MSISVHAVFSPETSTMFPKRPIDCYFHNSSRAYTHTQINTYPFNISLGKAPPPHSNLKQAG